MSNLSMLVNELNNYKNALSEGRQLSSSEIEMFNSSVDQYANEAIEGCTRGLQGIGKLISYFSPDIKDCDESEFIFDCLGDLISDLADLIGACQIVKYREEGGAE